MLARGDATYTQRVRLSRAKPEEIQKRPQPTVTTQGTASAHKTQPRHAKRHLPMQSSAISTACSPSVCEGGPRTASQRPGMVRTSQRMPVRSGAEGTPAEILHCVQDRFQYLKGAIKGDARHLADLARRLFQYLKGAIKGQLQADLIQTQGAFQYLKGAIKGSRSASPSSTEQIISIPQRCD